MKKNLEGNLRVNFLRYIPSSFQYLLVSLVLLRNSSGDEPRSEVIAARWWALF